MKKIMLTLGLYLFSFSLQAASPPPQHGQLALGNDGYVFAHVDLQNSDPEFRFCPKGYKFGEIAGGDGYGCVPSGKSPKWDGSFERSLIVSGITGQQYLDQKFGKNATTFVGVTPTNGNSNRAATIFYRVNKK